VSFSIKKQSEEAPPPLKSWLENSRGRRVVQILNVLSIMSTNGVQLFREVFDRKRKSWGLAQNHAWLENIEEGSKYKILSLLGTISLRRQKNVGGRHVQSIPFENCG